MRAALLLLALTVPAAAACTETPSDLPPCVDPGAQCAPLDGGDDAGDAGDAGAASAIDAAMGNG
jgi:hypothetical protein